MENIIDLNTLLIYLSGAGAAYVAGKVISWVAENIPAWHNLHKTVKTLLPMLLSILITMGAQALLNAQLAPEVDYWATVAIGAVVMYYGTQKGYMEAKINGYGQKNEYMG